MQCARSVPYCHLCPVSLYIFPHYLIHSKTFGKSYWTWNARFFSTTFVWTIYLKGAERGIINVHSSSCSVHYSRQIWIKLEFSRQTFEKYSKNELSWKSDHWKPSCSTREGGKTNMTQLTVAVRNLVCAPTRKALCHHISSAYTNIFRAS
jgi:hypothetical protein